MFWQHPAIMAHLPTLIYSGKNVVHKVFKRNFIRLSLDYLSKLDIKLR